jgi:hypothetical protein
MDDFVLLPGLFRFCHPSASILFIYCWGLILSFFFCFVSGVKRGLRPFTAAVFCLALQSPLFSPSASPHEATCVRCIAFHAPVTEGTMEVALL